MDGPSRRLLAEGFFDFKKTCSEGLCWVKGCRNDRRHDRCLCHKHEMQRWRSKRKQTAAYCTLRDHARERKIAFEITPDYWKGLTDAYCFYTVTEGEFLTVDRVDACKGYEPGNLRIISISLNIAKGNRERHLPAHVQEMMRREREAAREECAAWLEDEDDSDCPF